MNKPMIQVRLAVIKAWFRRLVVGLMAVMAIVLVVMAFYNRQADDPIPMTNLATKATVNAAVNDALPNAQDTRHITATLSIDDSKAHPLLAKLMARFGEHYPNITLTYRTGDTADIYLGAKTTTPPNDSTSFAYALMASPDLIANQSNSPSPTQGIYTQSMPVMVGTIANPSPAAWLFRDFLLSSIAQDIFVDEGLISIEPYRHFSHSLLKNDTTAPSTP